MSSATTLSTRAGYFSTDFDAGELGRFYREHGFFVIDSAFSLADVEALKAETLAICRGQRGAVRGTTPVDPSESDEAVLRRYLCLHFPHKISTVMRDALFNAPTVRALTAAVGPNVKCMQSMLFIKPSGKPGQAWHQDEDYIPTRDRSLIGAWIALDRATVENGCLWIIPGSHRPGVLWDQHWHGDRRFDCSEEARGFPYTDADAVPVEVEAGSVVFFNGYTLHRSLPNRAPAGTFRRALVNHYMSCESFLPWRLPAGEPKASLAKLDWRDVVVVAGRDPYAHHGYADSTQAYLREDGRSGCVDWVTDKPNRYADES
jgi:ectoine hydroxylase-related dioxygenase (phytanoyl-CoA dioxygenase family)